MQTRDIIKAEQRCIQHKMAVNSETLNEHESAPHILASLCAKAPDNEIRDCLRRYNPSHSLKQQKSSLKPVIVKTLAKTAKYLNINSDMNKDPLIHNIICKIQNLLPDTCKICQEVYCSKLEDNPFLACHVCGQEVHRPCVMKLFGISDATVCPEINPHQLPGLHYLCPECENEIIPPDDAPNAPVGNHTPKDPTPDTQLDSENFLEVSDDNTLASEEIVIESPTDIPEQLTIKVSTEINQTPNSEQTNDNSKQNDDKKICIHYKKNQCKHGMKGHGCPFYHPERCKKLMQFGTSQPDGCNLGRKCPSFHPKMCPSSITKHECFDEKCTFTHIKGTKRKKLSSVEKVKSSSANKMPNPMSTGNPQISTTPPTVGVKSPANADTQSTAQSFLEMIRLLKEEMVEAIETKIATALSQLPQYHPTVPLQSSPHNLYPLNLYPQNLYQHLQPSQLQMPQYPMMMPPPMFPPQKPPQMI